MNLAIITGASRGIGAAAAQTFLDNGYTVVSVSRSQCPVVGVESILLDLLSDTAEQVLEAKLVSYLAQAQRVTVIHNAAMLEKDSAKILAAESLRRVLDLNVVAPSRLNRVLIPYMKPGSSILFVGSTLSRKAVANSCSYVTSKHALMGLMRSTTQDLVGSGIHTVMVMPGFTNTEMLREHIGNDESIIKALSASVAMGRLAEPQEIADTLWLASQNPVLNGAEIDANLGQIEA